MFDIDIYLKKKKELYITLFEGQFCFHQIFYLIGIFYLFTLFYFLFFKTKFKCKLKKKV